jgi:hypothetical protein
MRGGRVQKPRIDTRRAYDPKKDWPGGTGYQKGAVVGGRSGRQYRVAEDGSLRRIKS